MCVPTKEQLRNVLLFVLFKKANASAPSKSPHYVYGVNSLRERICKGWFSRFKSGDFVLMTSPGVRGGFQKDTIQRIWKFCYSKSSTSGNSVRNLMFVIRPSYANWKGLERFLLFENGPHMTKIYKKSSIMCQLLRIIAYTTISNHLFGKACYWWRKMDIFL